MAPQVGAQFVKFKVRCLSFEFRIMSSIIYEFEWSSSTLNIFTLLFAKNSNWTSVMADCNVILEP